MLRFDISGAMLVREECSLLTVRVESARRIAVVVSPLADKHMAPRSGITVPGGVAVLNGNPRVGDIRNRPFEFENAKSDITNLNRA
jgi:hypothetical protein